MVNLFVRAWLMVALVSLNTIQIAHGRFMSAVVVGFLISYVWRWNARSSVTAPGTRADIVYALGAATGTATGLFLGG